MFWICGYWIRSDTQLMYTVMFYILNRRWRTFIEMEMKGMCRSCFSLLFTSSRILKLIGVMIDSAALAYLSNNISWETEASWYRTTWCEIRIKCLNPPSPGRHCLAVITVWQVQWLWQWHFHCAASSSVFKQGKAAVVICHQTSQWDSSALFWFTIRRCVWQIRELDGMENVLFAI